MRKLTSLALLLLPILSTAQVSGSISLAQDPTVPNCPLLAGGTMFTLTAPTDFDDLTIDDIKNCTVVSGIDDNGNFYLSFADTSAAHSITIHDNSTGEDIGTITFTVSTLNGVTPNFSPPKSGIPIGYADVITVPACSVAPFTYTGPTVYYTSGGNPYGTPMGSYDWTAPKGWLINGVLSTGSNAVESGETVTLTPDPLDPLSSGTITYCALNSCNPGSLEKSKQMKILVTPRASISISANGSNPVTVTCGQTTPVTFKVSGLSGISCVTGYKWNLSSTDGWLYNGAVPTGPVTTTTDSIVLTPNPGDTTRNVSVTLMVNGTASSYTYTEPVTYTVVIPAMGIAGANAVCQNNAGPFTFVAYNVPSNATVTWSVNMAEMSTPLSYTIGGNTITFTNPTASKPTGVFGMTATIKNICFTTSVDYGVYDEAPLPEPVISGGAQYLCPEATTEWTVPSTLAGAGNIINAITWDYDVDDWIYWGGGLSENLTLQANIDFYATNISVYYTNACGNSPTEYYWVAPIPSQDCGDALAAEHKTLEKMTDSTETTPPSYRLFPNPASGTVTVIGDTITQVRVYDLLGKTRKRIDVAGGVSNLSIPVSDLETGVYFVEIFNGNRRIMQKLLVRR